MEDTSHESIYYSNKNIVIEYNYIFIPGIHTGVGTRSAYSFGVRHLAVLFKKFFGSVMSARFVLFAVKLVYIIHQLLHYYPAHARTECRPRAAATH